MRPVGSLRKISCGSDVWLIRGYWGEKEQKAGDLTSYGSALGKGWFRSVQEARPGEKREAGDGAKVERGGIKCRIPAQILRK